MHANLGAINVFYLISNLTGPQDGELGMGMGMGGIVTNVIVEGKMPQSELA